MMTRHKIVQRILALMLAVALLFSYVPNVEAASKSKVTSVKVTNLPSTTLTLKKGASKTLKVKVEGSKNVSQAVTYKTSKPKIVKVTQKGKLTAKKKGKSKITIISNVDKTKKAVITVTVGTPVTKVTLNKKSASLEEGKTLTLKATVKTKKASNKKLIWSTSNANVATVSKKGVVKAVSPGTAKITAKAADGSGKKATATITVTKKVVIKSVSIVNDRTVKVDLDGTKKLTKSNFTVKLNATGKGGYNYTSNIDSIISSKDQSYLLIMENNIPEGHNIQVTVSGIGSKTATYSAGNFSYTNESVYQITYDAYINTDFYLNGAVGYSTCTATNLPSGITMQYKGDRVVFAGKTTQKGRVISKLVAKDERGNTFTYTIHWMIVNEDTIAATAYTAYGLLQSNGTVSPSIEIKAYGGSSSYTYSLEGNTYGLYMSGNKIYGSISAAGTYNLKVKVSDANNKNISTVTTVTIHVVDAISVSGVVKDLSGNAIPSAYVNYVNKDRANKYSPSKSAYCDSNGMFSISLDKGKYDVEAICTSGNKVIKSQQVVQDLTSTRSGYDFVLPVQKVAISSNDANINATTFGTWYDAAGNSYGSGAVLYLKPGKYSLTSTTSTATKDITAKVNVTVTETSAATATATVTTKSKAVPSIKAEQKIDLKLTGNYVYYAFTPTETGKYYFYSISTRDTFGRLYNSNDILLTSNDDGGDGNNFLMSYNCTAGTTYYFGAKLYSTGSADVSLVVSATDPKEAAQ